MLIFIVITTTIVTHIKTIGAQHCPTFERSTITTAIPVVAVGMHRDPLDETAAPPRQAAASKCAFAPTLRDEAGGAATRTLVCTL